MDEVKKEVRENGMGADEAEAIRPDGDADHLRRLHGENNRVTVLLHMRRTEHGVAFCKKMCIRDRSTSAPPELPLITEALLSIMGVV